MKQYVCECGKTFTTPNSFNGHKSHCTVHLEKTGRLDIRQQVDASNGSKQSKSLKDRAKRIAEAKLKQWIAEQHTCEKCKKIMNTKYGSGRFCSQSCANSRDHTEATRSKISVGIYNSSWFQMDVQARKSASRADYEKNSNHCEVCQAVIPYEKRYRKTCSDECESALNSRNSKDAVIRHGGNLNQKGFKSHFQGNYKGFHCDSTWELAFIVYHLENNIPFERNTEYFPYTYAGSEHNYFPDFIVDGVYYEVKGYHNDVVQAKIDQFPKDKKLVVLYYNEMKHMIDYCSNKYGTRYWEVLYK